MKLHIRNVYPTDPSTLWDVFYDPEFDKRLEDSSSVRYEPIEEREENGIHIRKSRVVSKKELPMVMRKAIGADRLTYVQVNRLDRANNRLEWEVIPDMMADRVTAKGTTICKEVDGGTERTIDGEITVRVRFIGGQIEKIIVGEVEKSFVRASEIAKQLIEERQG